VRGQRGRAWKAGDNVDTDQIIAGRYLSLTDPQELASHCFEESYPELSTGFASGDVLVAGENFGCGSSREHAVIALKTLGVSCIIASSYARIFFRNCLNLGLLPLECPDAAAGIEPGDEVHVDPDAGRIENVSQGLAFEFKPLPPFLQEILAAGDMTAYVRQRLSQAHSQEARR
jgi:3-isopropylmalate/(R)-2-methylmalate dehydratase small subunit